MLVDSSDIIDMSGVVVDERDSSHSMASKDFTSVYGTTKECTDKLPDGLSCPPSTSAAVVTESPDKWVDDFVTLVGLDRVLDLDGTSFDVETTDAVECGDGIDKLTLEILVCDGDFGGCSTSKPGSLVVSELASEWISCAKGTDHSLIVVSSSSILSVAANCATILTNPPLNTLT